MSDQPSKQVSHTAIAVEAAALNDFYRNRTLLLADEIERQRNVIHSQKIEIDRLTRRLVSEDGGAAREEPESTENG